jgi:hypothetical protein
MVPESLRPAGTPARDRGAAFAIIPGPKLIETIARAAGAGRPSWSLDGIVVPRLEQVPIVQPSGRRVLRTPREMSPLAQTLLGNNIRAALDSHQEVNLARDYAEQDTRAELRALASAARHDVLLWPVSSKQHRDTISAAYGFEDDSSAHRAMRRGRRTWASLAAWPWWATGGDTLLRGWWAHPRVLDTLEAWINPEQWLEGGE